MSEQPCLPAGPNRRAVVLSGCGLAGGALLAGCATYGPTAPAAAPAPAPAPSAADGPLAATTDVPVGGGLVLAARGVVLTQPVAGTFKAFSSTCTHQGCTVNEVVGGTINCPCHGSKYNATDGSVVGGPAPAPLAAVAVAVDGSNIVASA